MTPLITGGLAIRDIGLLNIALGETSYGISLPMRMDGGRKLRRENIQLWKELELLIKSMELEIAQLFGSYVKLLQRFSNLELRMTRLSQEFHLEYYMTK